ncbi:hypothetical protein JQK62_14530 [Leptospira santarosai]|nr:hypothetical protein [Leptospira santarosai]
MFFFKCDKPKEITEENFRTLLQEKSDSQIVEYLGIEKDKAILKVSNSFSADSKLRKEEFFYTKAHPSLILWIDENLYKITVPNFTKIYNFLLRQPNQQFKFEQWTILTRDDSGKKPEVATGKKTIRITVDGRTRFIFDLRSDGITSFSLNIKHAPNDKKDLKYKKLWLQLLNHIQNDVSQ